MNLLDRIPLWALVAAALLLGLAPFFPEPHLVQKAKMLLAGELVDPRDIFDVVFHGGPIVLVLWKLKRGRGDSGEAPDDIYEG